MKEWTKQGRKEGEKRSEEEAPYSPSLTNCSTNKASMMGRVRAKYARTQYGIILVYSMNGAPG